MADVVVIGAGPSGLACAIGAAARGASVTVLESSQRIGSKILATGNGRCNLTNMGLSPNDYNACAFVAPVLSVYDPKRIRHFFMQLGLLTVEEREGRVYPLSNTANSVLDVLRFAVERMDIHVMNEFTVASVTRQGHRLLVTSEHGVSGTADKVVVATGGGSELLGRLGHTLVPFQPVLCSLATSTEPLRGLSGVRAQARLSAFSAHSPVSPFFQEDGEVLFRDYGVSGIVAFNASREVLAGDILSLDFVADMTLSQVEDLLEKRVFQFPGLSNSQLLCGVFHPRLITALLRVTGLRPADQASGESARRLAKAAKAFRLEVKGMGDAKHAQVTRGGALVDEFDPKTMESRRMPGLYAVGEALNVDGRCGGYNLHWAWASGLAAGTAAAG